MAEIDDIIEDTRVELRKAFAAAKDKPDVQKKIQQDLIDLADLEDQFDLDALLDKAKALNALSDILGKAIATIKHNIANFLLDDLLRVKGEVDSELGKPQPKPKLKPAPKPKPSPTTPGPDSGSGRGKLQAKPGKHRSVINRLIAGAEAQKLDPMMVLAIVAIESDFDPEATSPLSSAGGLFQFLDTTWIAAGGKKFPGRGGKGNGHAAGAPIDDQIKIGCKFIAKNIKSLTTKLGKPPSNTAVYMAHQQGLGGALKILMADPMAAIESVIGDKAARNNALSSLTVAQAIDKFHNLVRAHEDEVRGLVFEISPDDKGGGPVVEGPSINGTIGEKAVKIALREMETFARNGTKKILETAEPLNSRVIEYMRFVGTDVPNGAAEPWSAGFVSFVIHSAGATNDQFPKSPNHAKYILAALVNRINNRFDAPIVFFERHEKSPRVGDLIGFSRTSRVKNKADMEALLDLPKDKQFFPSHTDLVIDVSPGKIKAIGGNVSHTISTTTVRTDAEGNIVPSAKHFFILRLNI